ncbi:Chromophore lyase CpcS/CpeS 3 [Porphyridium purpureum]|uniref:Chromophore lyase CpcS/CpeS 3 n=1 Tax=Porphyridium purpureum TaxID=35688 RepID=A0A5J4YKK7_PORPP|nr:Chromophore lyase CpcS/CpeS 3 [Porphyridium purpureum]|eukprot:POR5357..scf261_15
MAFAFLPVGAHALRNAAPRQSKDARVCVEHSLGERVYTARAHRVPPTTRFDGTRSRLRCQNVNAEVGEESVEHAGSEESVPAQPPFSARGMGVEEFFQRSIGEWRSQRSSHNLLWQQFEQVESEIVIENVTAEDEEVKGVCEQYKADADSIALAIRMSWEGTSDWDEDEVLKGSTVLVVLKDSETSGRLLRSVGYAEEIPAVGQWRMETDGVFVLDTSYDRAGAEERIWFATPDLRMRVSMIKTAGNTGVLTASFSSEIRRRGAGK